MHSTTEALIAWVGPRDPFLPGVVEGTDRAGPVLRMFRGQTFSRVFLLASPEQEALLEATCAELAAADEDLAVETAVLGTSAASNETAFAGEVLARIRSWQESNGLPGEGECTILVPGDRFSSSLALLKATAECRISARYLLERDGAVAGRHFNSWQPMENPFQDGEFPGAVQALREPRAKYDAGPAALSTAEPQSVPALL